MKKKKNQENPQLATCTHAMVVFGACGLAR